MPSIGGEFVEWAPPGTSPEGPEPGLPRDPYVFTSLAYVADLPDARARQILARLRPYLLGEVDVPPGAPQQEDAGAPQPAQDDEDPKIVLHLPLLTADEYATLRASSQYVAWHVTNTLAVRAAGKLDAVNHVAYVLNDSEPEDGLSSCAAINAFLESHGWTLNTYAGATIQADDDAATGYAFRQSSVVASPVMALFAGDAEPTAIPSIFHEFVEHPMTLPFRGFSNARALFASTSAMQQQRSSAAVSAPAGQAVAAAG
mmetsp:Transcript_19303/g.76873  ORF Transcript_19303/g.76873 Transcript_19303/m.76873 type:complete len:258 (+) Transcript_19303:411-1184(+)